MVDLITSNCKLERKMSTISSDLDQERSSAHKATKHCTSWCILSIFLISGSRNWHQIKCQWRHQRNCGLKSLWLLFDMINCGPKSVWLLVLGGPKSVGRNQDGPKSVVIRYWTYRLTIYPCTWPLILPGCTVTVSVTHLEHMVSDGPDGQLVRTVRAYVNIR